MLIRVFALRHAECVMNTYSNRVGGRVNHSPLTSKGLAQAESVGEYLSKRRIKPFKVFVSPALRTRETASIVCKQLHIDSSDIQISADLQEIFQGDWEGQRRDQFHTDEVIERMQQQGWEFKSPGGESVKDVGARLKSFLDAHVYSLLEDAPAWKRGTTPEEKHVLIVSHALTIKCMLQHTLQSATHLTWKHKLDNTAVSEFVFDSRDQMWSLQRWNDASHLQKLEDMK